MYLVLRCAVYLVNSRKTSQTLRYLAVAEGENIEDPNVSCRNPSEGPSYVAGSTIAEEEGEEGLAWKRLSKRAHRYVTDLARLIHRSEPVLRRLDPQMRAMCIAGLLCLSLVELAALLTLLKGRHRQIVYREMHTIQRRIWALRDSIRNADLSISRQRHIKQLHILLDRIKEVEPATALTERQRLLRIKHLLQLQEMALGQLNIGIVWMRESLELREKAGVETKASDAAAKGVSLAVEGGAAVAAAAHVTAATSEGAITNTAALTSAAERRLASVVWSIRATVHKRREQVLLDALLSRWLREVHKVDLHYGLVRKSCLDAIAQMPRKNHMELLEDLQDTPLGRGEEPWESEDREGEDAEQGIVTPTPLEASSPKEALFAGGATGASLDLGRLNISTPSSQTEASAGELAGVSASPSEATTPAGERQQTTLHASSSLKAMPSRAASTVPSHVSPPTAAGHLEGFAFAAAPQPAVVPSSLAQSPGAAQDSKKPCATFFGSSLAALRYPGSLPMPSLISFRAAASAASAYTPKEITLWRTSGFVQGPVGPAAAASQGAPVASLGAMPASTASRPSPAVTEVFETPLEGSRPHLKATIMPPTHHHAYSTLSASPGEALRAWPSQAQGIDRVASKDPRTFIRGPAMQLFEASASPPLPASPFKLTEGRSSSEIPQSRVPVDIYGTPITFREWGLAANQRIPAAAGLLPTTKPDEPGPAAIAAGFAALEDRFRGESGQ
ncbi:hypothetical protein EMWEY_00034640 [Eimeria maxima]|uniref:Uncharacterized protein n=1 Tax=Eimeria maxima TaxID=5804 RepID=U6MCH4_EIMMA|nr:hypothetical protein EMWEY_00034640 [Eimeria maxima]CDJ60763.1 hypothetical protein EMWEY_00034640 [Eimeria maxima]